MNVWSKVLTQVGELEMAIDCVKTGGGSDSERKEEEQEEMKLGMMSFKRIEKEAVSVTSVVKALLQERGRDGVCF